MGVVPDHILVDGGLDFVGSGNTTCLVKGDATSVSISAASVLAKVVHDRIMRELSPHFPDYEFGSNKGYHSPDHKAALLATGPSGIHRRSLKSIKNLPRTGIPRHARPDPTGALSDPVDYSRLIRFFGPDSVTRP